VDISNYQPERRIYKGYQKDLTLRNNKKTLRTDPFSAKGNAIHSGISLGLSVIPACPESFRKRRIPAIPKAFGIGIAGMTVDLCR
jgi:hypothetical protein